MLNDARQTLPIGDFLVGSSMTEHSNEQFITDLPSGVGPPDFSKLEFVLAEQPNTVHPSLHAEVRKAFNDRGLFKIAQGIYQVRGDIAHVTFVRGKTGWIILDTGVSIEFAKGAWLLLQTHVDGADQEPITAVVYSHSDAVHFGGVKGLISQAQVDAGEIDVIAPYNFMQEVISESIIAGNAMMRRGTYHFGVALDINTQGTGSVPIMTTAGGTSTLIAPTIVLPQGQGKITRRLVDGVEIHFMDISSAEAPSATLLYRIIHVWGKKLEHMTGPHGPNFSGRDRILEFLRLQRDSYAFLHNQTMKLANSGMKIQDVGESVTERIPKNLSQVWHTRGYHGTYSHNARGVLNRYLGFYDGNPANLNPLKIEPQAIKYVEYMGGAEAILQRARADFDSGEYRFVATVLSKLVIAQPNLWTARHLLADSYEQLGYQSEGPQWRNTYLTAAKELRTGKVAKFDNLGDSRDILQAASTENLLDAMAIKVSSEKASAKDFSMLLILSDVNEIWILELSSGVLSYFQLHLQLHKSSNRLRKPSNTDIQLSANRAALLKLIGGMVDVEEFIKLDSVSVEGSLPLFKTMIDALEADKRNFAIVPLSD